MDEMLTIKTSNDDPFLSHAWNNKATTNGQSNTGATSPFPFDLHICDYSGATPLSMPISAAATPATGDVASPFFSDFDPRKVPAALQPAFMADQAKTEDEKDLLGHDNEATYRKRALQRLSLTSSVFSSAPSTAPSETEEDPNESDWDTLSIKRSNSNAADNSEAFDSGFYAAFSAHTLAGPCSFKSQGSEAEAAFVNAQSDGTIRAANYNTNDPHGRGHHASALSVFNLADFISDVGHSPEPSSTATGTEDLTNGNSNPTPAARTEILGIQGHSPNVTAVKVEQNGLAPQSLNAHTTPTRLTSRFDNMDLGQMHPQQAAGPAGPVFNPFTPMTQQQLQAGAAAAPMHPGLHSGFQAPHFAIMQSPEPVARLQQQRSMSFNGHVGTAAEHLSTPERPLVHPSLLRVGKMETPVRSPSSPIIHDPLSCNPAHITPGSSNAATTNDNNNASIPGRESPAFATALSSPSPAFAQNLFGLAADFPDSPASSVLSSPSHWATALCGDDFGEETYKVTHASSSLSSAPLSSSLPSRPLAMRAYSDTYQGSPSPSPSGQAGHPMRPARSTAGAASAAPYASPSFGSPISGQHLLPPSHPLAHLQDPYSGVITKRSRGRRVPNTPEEMTNIGKSGKVYTCKVPGCGKLFKRSEHLKRHIRSIHTNEKPYVCAICLKQFSRHDNLNQHMRVHGSGSCSASSAASEINASPGASSPRSSPMSRSPSTASRRGSSSSSQLFHETRGGTITRRNINLTEDGVFDFEQAD